MWDSSPWSPMSKFQSPFTCMAMTQFSSTEFELAKLYSELERQSHLFPVCLPVCRLRIRSWREPPANVRIQALRIIAIDDIIVNMERAATAVVTEKVATD